MSGQRLCEDMEGFMSAGSRENELMWLSIRGRKSAGTVPGGTYGTIYKEVADLVKVTDS